MVSIAVVLTMVTTDFNSESVLRAAAADVSSIAFEGEALSAVDDCRVVDGEVSTCAVVGLGAVSWSVIEASSSRIAGVTFEAVVVLGSGWYWMVSIAVDSVLVQDMAT